MKDDGGDDKKAERLKPLPFVRPAGKARPEKEALLPSLGDPYQAAGFADSEASRLVLIMGKDGFKPGGTAYYFLQYVHIGLGEFGFEAGGQFFRFVFADIQPKLVTVHGRNLLRMCDAVALRRVLWARQAEADRDFRAEPAPAKAGGGGVGSSEPFISRIEVADWVREED